MAPDDVHASAGHASDPPPPDGTDPTDATSEEGAAGDDGASGASGSFDLRGVVRQLTAPMIESLDTRLRSQIEEHVDQLLDEKLDAALADRLQIVDRAIADLSRSLDDLARRLSSLERTGEPDPEA